MLIYVDLEHDRLERQEPELWARLRAGRLQQKYRFEEISGQPCLLVRYDRLNLNLIRELRPQVRAVLVSGCYTDFEHYSEESLAGLRALFRGATWPTIGFCAGFQLMAAAHGAEIGPIGAYSAADALNDQVSEVRPGQKGEFGFLPVRVQSRHPLFAGLPAQPIVRQAHYWEVKSLPAGFQNLAESDLCARQAAVHVDLPLFGVQFHPEQYDEAHPHGRQIVRNFFEMVGALP